jgi:hypothetical protein
MKPARHFPFFWNPCPKKKLAFPIAIHRRLNQFWLLNVYWGVWVKRVILIYHLAFPSFLK